jgi:hypothetical protein
MIEMLLILLHITWRFLRCPLHPEKACGAILAARRNAGCEVPRGSDVECFKV